MTTSQQRVSRLGVVYGLLVGVVFAHLAIVMLGQHEDWLVRSYQNRWSFRDVPTVRGALRDRFDRVLADDAPTFTLECVYERFRLLHPVGAAVHGATVASLLFGQQLSYGYRSPTLGPTVALQALLDLPVSALRGDELSRDDRKLLAQAVVTVLAASAERSPADVRADLRRAAKASPEVAIGDALANVERSRIEQGFAGILARLRALDEALRRLVAERRNGGAAADLAGAGAGSADDDDDDEDPDDGGENAGGGGTAAPKAGRRAPLSLLERLDRYRDDSMQERRTRRKLADGTLREGELLERLARPLLRDVPFELAAAVRVAAFDQPGLMLEPMLRRQPAADMPPTLKQILGRVADLDRGPLPKDYVDARVEAAIGGGLDELVPDDLAPTPEYRSALLDEAQRSYARVLRTRERRGTGGIESMLDDELAGSPGLRLVERDASRREQLLWSSLRVEPGRDVALSVDLDLQRLLDQHVESAARHWQSVAEARRAAGQVAAPELVDVGMAILIAGTGEVLALASAPRDLDGVPRLPAVLSWRGNGALGSVVKPLMLVEHLTSVRGGAELPAFSTYVPCELRYKGRDGVVYRCDSTHGDQGRDPVTAIARSCNVFFYQLAEGLGEGGQRRALWRFGLLPPMAGGGDGRGIERPAELPAAMAAAPRWTGRQTLQRRGIGYGLEANPLHVAAAYAALATGELPELSLRRGGTGRRFPLGADPEDLALVEQGLVECVQHGTADDTGLDAFAVRGKTGTAEIALGSAVANNAWFAGWLPAPANGGAQLAFCAVVYAVPDKIHGADAAGLLVAEVLAAIAQDPVLQPRYLVEGR